MLQTFHLDSKESYQLVENGHPMTSLMFLLADPVKPLDAALLRFAEQENINAEKMLLTKPFTQNAYLSHFL